MSISSLGDSLPKLASNNAENLFKKFCEIDENLDYISPTVKDINQKKTLIDVKKAFEGISENFKNINQSEPPLNTASSSSSYSFAARSEEHTSELQSHSFISYAVFCLKKKKHDK